MTHSMMAGFQEMCFLGDLTVDSNSLEFILLHTSYLSNPTRLTCVESNFLWKAFIKILMEMTPDAAAMVVFTYVSQP